MPKLPLNNLIEFPIPKHNITVISTHNQNLLTKLFNIKNGIISFEYFYWIVFVLTLFDIPYLHSTVPTGGDQMFLPFGENNCGDLGFVTFESFQKLKWLCWPNTDERVIIGLWHCDEVFVVGFNWTDNLSG